MTIYHKSWAKYENMPAWFLNLVWGLKHGSARLSGHYQYFSHLKCLQFAGYLPRCRGNWSRLLINDKLKRMSAFLDCWLHYTVDFVLNPHCTCQHNIMPIYKKMWYLARIHLSFLFWLLIQDLAAGAADWAEQLQPQPPAPPLGIPRCFQASWDK